MVLSGVRVLFIISINGFPPAEHTGLASLLLLFNSSLLLISDRKITTKQTSIAEAMKISLTVDSKLSTSFQFVTLLCDCDYSDTKLPAEAILLGSVIFLFFSCLNICIMRFKYRGFQLIYYLSSTVRTTMTEMIEIISVIIYDKRYNHVHVLCKPVRVVSACPFRVVCISSIS